jgi:hypothetical protein
MRGEVTDRPRLVLVERVVLTRPADPYMANEGSE